MFISSQLEGSQKTLVLLFIMRSFAFGKESSNISLRPNAVGIAGDRISPISTVLVL